MLYQPIKTMTLVVFLTCPIGRAVLFFFLHVRIQFRLVQTSQRRLIVDWYRQVREDLL